MLSEAKTVISHRSQTIQRMELFFYRRGICTAVKSQTTRVIDVYSSNRIVQLPGC